MTTSNTDQQSGDFSTWLIIVGAAALFGPGLLARFVPAAQQFLLESRILTADDLVITIAPGVGLDLARVVIAAGIAGLLLLITVTTIIRRNKQEKP